MSGPNFNTDESSDEDPFGLLHDEGKWNSFVTFLLQVIQFTQYLFNCCRRPTFTRVFMRCSSFVACRLPVLLFHIELDIIIKTITGCMCETELYQAFCNSLQQEQQVQVENLLRVKLNISIILIAFLTTSYEDQLSLKATA